MARFHSLSGLCLFITMILSRLGCLTAAAYRAPAGYQPSRWTLAHATFYGDESAASTMGTY